MYNNNNILCIYNNKLHYIMSYKPPKRFNTFIMSRCADYFICTKSVGQTRYN